MKLTESDREFFKTLNMTDKDIAYIESLDEEEIKHMFGVVVGNPPYQEDTQAKTQIHQDFLELGYYFAKDQVSMLEPLNWLNNQRLLNKMRPHLTLLARFSDASKLFPRALIASGVGISIINQSKTVNETTVIEDDKTYKATITGNYNRIDNILIEKIHPSKTVFDRIVNFSAISALDKTLTEKPLGKIQLWYKQKSGKGGYTSGLTLTAKTYQTTR